MKILVLTPSATDTCSFYRSGGIFPDLQKKLNCEVRLSQWDKIILHWQEIIKYDLVMLQRPFEASHLSFCNYLKELQIPLWIDFDDNLLALGGDNPKYDLYDAPARENIKTMLKMADVVSVTTEDLKKAYEPLNKEIHVIPNAFNDFMFKRRELNSGRAPMMFWRGSDTHQYDVLFYSSAINQAMKEFSEWQFLYMGWYPYFLDKHNNFFKMGAMDVVYYFNNVRKFSPTLLHVPLYDSPFNRAKSNIAFIEAAYFGAVCLAPDWDAWQVDGILHYTDNQSYFDAIKAVATGAVDTTAMAKIAWQYVQDNLRLSQINVKRMELINSLL